jgi:hypothetical protein
MPDWRTYVRERFSPEKWAAAEREEIVSELATHLEELYTAMRSQGMTEADAMRETKTNVGNWEELRRGILTAKKEHSMNDRVRQLWVPALVTLTLANVALALLLRVHLPLSFVPVGSYASLCLYVPWLLMLPFIGGVGSSLARRGEGRGWKVYFAATFPAVVLGGLFLLILGFVSIFDRNTARHIQLSGFLLGVTGWVVLPTIALLVGAALESLLNSARRPNPGKT